MVEIIQADILDWAAGYDGPPFHAILCDPPYALGKGKDPNKGFMGKEWDNGIAFRPDTWRALARCLFPGAFIMSFGGSRTFHRLAVAMEDAGLELHPAIFGWVSGQSFPKATRIDTQIDEAAGAEREVVGISKGAGSNARGYIPTSGGELKSEFEASRPATPLARAWAGHRYGKQALKPSVEPVIVSQVPYRGRPVDCIVETGAGTFWIDGGRIPTGDSLAGGGYQARASEGWDRPFRHDPDRTEELASKKEAFVAHAERLGRWPSHLYLVHLPGCRQVGTERVKTNWTDPHSESHGTGQGVTYLPSKPQGQVYADPDGYETVIPWECEEECPVRQLAEQARPVGPVKTIAARMEGTPLTGKDFVEEVIRQQGEVLQELSSWQCQEGCPVRQLAEQGGNSKSSGGSGEATRIRDRGSSYAWKHPQEWENMGGLGDTGPITRFFFNADWSLDVAEQLDEASPLFYCSKASRREREAGLENFAGAAPWNGRGSDRGIKVSRAHIPIRNTNPCCKPLTLLKYLATILLPPKEYAPRRILVPFAGSGSEAISAALAGFEEVVGIEREEEYVRIARARATYWTGPGASCSPLAAPQQTNLPAPSRGKEQLEMEF